jgi:hypothetical protein
LGFGTRDDKALHAASSRRDFLAARDDPEQPIAHVIVLDGIDDHALSRAGDAREHRGRRVLQHALGRLAGEQRQRHQIALAPVVGVLDRHDREE